MLIQHSPFLRCPVTMGQSLVPPPPTSSLELWLQSNIGLSAYADTAVVTTWPDQSGNARDALASLGGIGPGAKINRTGSHRSANGQPAVVFTGLEAPNSTEFACATPNPEPSNALGWDFFFYGRLAAVINAVGASTVWTTRNGSRPELDWTRAPATPTALILWGDDAGFPQATQSPPMPQYGLFEWRFNPPNNGTGIGEVYINGVSQGINSTWTWNNGSSTGYILGSNIGHTQTMLGDLFSVLWYSRILTAAERTLLNLYMVSQFG